jgi:hypothetical protein
MERVNADFIVLPHLKDAGCRERTSVQLVMIDP